MSKYESILNTLSTRIQTDHYPTYDALPTEAILADEFQCSRMTIKKVMNVLVKEGLVFRQRGKGTFVNRTNIASTKRVLSLNDFLPGQQLSFVHDEISSTIVDFTVGFPTPFVAERLAISATEAVYHLIRVRTFNNKPLIIESNYIPVKYFPNFDLAAANETLFGYIENKMKLKIDGAMRFITAEEANESDLKLLGIPINQAVLVIEALIHMHDGTIVLYSENRFAKDSFEVRVYTPRKK
ncbi:MAG: GntR family transcriptional regulator [Bacilli bacterium]